MRLTLHAKNCGSPAKEETGSALAGVLAVFAITILLASLAASATVNGLGFTSATRAGVQSQASAEAGISFALAEMTENDCEPEFTQGDVTGAGAANLHFTVKVFSRPTPTATWHDRCPGNGDNFVRFVSTGTPEANGLTNARGDTRTVEAIYNWSPGRITTEIKPSGAAIYSYSGGLFSGSSQLKNPDGLDTVINIAHGDAGCAFQVEGQSTIYEADIVVAEGSWDTGGSCQVKGNIWAYDDLTVKESSIIWGSIWASSLDMGQSSQIKENAWVGGNANMIETSAIVGHLTAASRTGPGVPGRQTIDPSIDGAKPEFPGDIEPVPPWVDFTFDREKDWSEFAYFNMNGPCNVATMQGAIDKMSIDSPGPSVLDTRNCVEDVTLWGAGMVLPNDVALVLGKRFYMSGAGPAISNNSEPRKLWLIQPDDTKDEQPSCPAGGYISLGLTYVVDATVSTMVYTPCAITLGQSAVWRGQFYGGGMTIAQSASLSYVPGGLPGVDLSDGSAPVDGGHYGAEMGDRISIRDLDAAN